MKFVSVREFKGKSGRAWKALSEERDIVLTSNGRPVAMLTAVTEDGVEESLKALRKARALLALDRIQAGSLDRGLDRLTARDIESEISEVRRRRRR